jgi:CBS domain-containing protein
MELARNLRVDSISRLQPAPPHAIEAHEPVQKAIEIMRRVRSGCLLVTRGGALVGSLTARDLLTRILATARPLTTPMDKCMTANPVTVHPKD